jgi:protein-tyrosine-phosphatase
LWWRIGSVCRWRSIDPNPFLKNSWPLPTSIVAMEGWQYDELRFRFKGYQDKLFLLPLFLKEATPQSGYEIYNIQDPYGGLRSVFEACFQKIEHNVKALLAEFGVKE